MGGKLKSINFIVTFCLLMFHVSHLSADFLRVATYNIWNPVFEEKYSGRNSWKMRFPYITENILVSKSDLICLEEVSDHAYQNLIQNSEIQEKYQSIYCSHAPSQPGQKEGRDGLALFYKPEKVTLLKFRVSADGSRPTHRRDFFADVKVNSSTTLRIACTHLDSGDDLEVGNLQLLKLVEEVQRDTSGIDFIVLCGDFNEGEAEEIRPRFQIMQQAGFITDGSFAPTRPEALSVRHKGHIDWIYFKPVSQKSFSLHQVKPIGDERGSDHKLTMTDIEVK